MSRTKNTKRNIVVGIINKAITIVMPFFVRTAIIYSLGQEYAGLSSLFTSILQVLNLAELGFSSAIVYNMYEPISNNDNKLINALLKYYRKVYKIMGSIILGIGLICLLFLPKLIKGSYPNDINIYCLFLIYLANTVLSYFLYAYKTSLVNAYQRRDLEDLLRTIVSCVQYIVQLIVIIYFKSYYFYALIPVLSTLITNICINIITNKKYPENKCEGELSSKVKEEIRIQVKGLMIGKICDTFRNSLDSIILSAFFGLVTVAVYGNYYYIYNALYGVTLIITWSMQASVGNSIATESIEKNYQDLRKFQFVFYLLISTMTSCLISLYQPFMTLWVGEDMLLSTTNMILFCVYFYAINMNNMRNLYATGTGIWWKLKNTYILEAASNLMLNIFLGKLLGVTGILLATIITIIIFNFIARTNILFITYFKRSPKEFYLEHVNYCISVIIVCIVSYLISCQFINSIMSIIEILIISIIVSIVINYILYFKTDIFKQSECFIKRLIK